MSTHQDPEIGVVTRDDLKDGIRVNEALAKTAQGDLDYLANRLAACDERIEFQERLKDQWREMAASAPERLERLHTKLAQQRLALERMDAASPPRAKSPTAPSALNREARIRALTDRIAKGDMTAIAELTALARG